MSKHTTKAYITTSALRVLAFTILLAFVWNQSVKILQISDTHIEAVADQTDDKQELEDALLLFAPSLRAPEHIVTVSRCTHYMNQDHLLVKTYAYELSSPPPELV